MMRPPRAKKDGDKLESGCPIEGPPDIPAIRDAHIPNASTPIKTIRLKINVFDFGSYRTQEDVDRQVAQLNADFLPWRIQFAAETEFIFQYVLPVDLTDTEELKPAFADSPETKLNVYVVVPEEFTGLVGYSYFPWWPDALDPIGGVVVHASFFGEGGTVLTHEIGHSFGLWHTFTGVSEVDEPCVGCYERADGLNGDTTGDLCSDTPPTPLNFQCGPPGGIDPCASTPWGPTMPDNVMGYGNCSSFQFTPQQAGRMHAWILERLSSWLVLDVAVSLSASPEPVMVGSNLTYTLSVSNRGETAITDLTVANVFPSNVFFTSSSSNVSWSIISNRVALTFPNIATGSTAVATLTVVALQAGPATNVLLLPANGLIAGQKTNRTELVGTIVGNPAVSGSMLIVRDAIVVEGNSGTTNAIFTVALLPASTSIVTTDFHTSNGLALEGSDYIATNGTLTFNPGETTKSVIVRVIGDTAREPEENFFLSLGPVANAFNVRLHAEGRILPDDLSLDLIVLQVLSPAHWATGTPLEITNTVQNIGTNDVRSRFTVGIYLSTDPFITTNDQLLATRVVYRLPTGASSSEVLPVAGLQVPPGTYYVGVIADIYNSINELDESNNVAGTVIESSLGPELVASFIGGSGRASSPSPYLEITNRIVNAGIGSANAFRVGFYLSTDPVIATNDLRVGFRTLTLAAGETNQDVTGVSLPGDLGSGPYYWGVIVDCDGEVLESNKLNNVLPGNTVEIVPGPDLVVTKMTGPPSVAQGNNVLVTSTVRNVGLTDVSIGFRLGFYLSSDATITTNDFFVGSALIKALATDTSLSVTAFVAIGAIIPTGTYYLGAIADDRNMIPETSEANNAFAGNQIQVAPTVDLVVTLLQAPTIVPTATPLIVTNVIGNVGSGFAPASEAGFYLTTDGPATTNDFRIGSRAVPFLVAPLTNRDTTSITLPPSMPLGNYFLTVIADHTNIVRETDEANNATAISVQIVAGPDMVTSGITGPAQGVTGRQITITNSVMNVGGWPATPSSRIRFYLSTDSNITTSDLSLGDRAVPALGIGVASTSNTTVSVSLSVPPGTYYLGAIADADQQVSETVETNNALAGQLIEIIAGPDLALTALAGPVTAVTGGSITVTDTVVNLGQSTAFTYAIGYFLSTNSNGATNDVLIGERATLFLSPGASDPATTVLTLQGNLPAGSYFLRAFVDWRQTVTEASETNNTMVIGPISVAAGPDIEVTAIAAPTVADRFSPIVVTNTVRNSGGGNVGTFNVGIYLSTDSVITTNDLKIGSRTIAGLSAGQNSTAETTASITTNLPPGTYFIGVFADDARLIAETSESNNTLPGIPIQIVSGPDLLVSAVAGPVRAPTGNYLAVTNTVQNVGTDPVTVPFVVRNFLADSTNGSLGLLLGNLTVTNALNAGQNLVVTGSYFVNLTGVSTGAYRLSAIVDAQQQVTELVETNNTNAGPLINVVWGPDLTMTAISIPTSAVSGNAITVTDTVANVGEGIVFYPDVGFYLSADATVTTADLFLGSRSPGLIAPGNSNSGTTSLIIPSSISAGNYYLGAIADYFSATPEANEQNNTIVGSIIISVGPDLNISLLGASASAGPLVPILVTNTVHNIGSGTATAFSVGIFVSSDTTITTNDLRVASRSISSLAPGASNTATTTVVLPQSLAPGSYFFGVIADEFDGVRERREDNNASATALLIVSGPDLIVSALAGPVSIVLGESPLVTNTVSNVGMTPVNASFSVGIYLSTDQAITKDDLRIGSRTLNGLGSGQSSTVATPVSSLTVIPGNYYFGAIVDYLDAVMEVNEANNTLLGNALTINPIIITSVRLEGADLLVDFASAAGKTYRLESAASLLANSIWQPVNGATTIAGTGGKISARHVGALSQPLSFYRVRLLE